MIKKIVKKVLKYPIRLLNSIYTYFYYKNSLKRDKYEIDDMITTKKEKILVFSPHVDDETIGLGATLLKYKAKDNQMALVYMTDGGGSTTSLSRDKLVEERRKEGYNVKKTYGFDTIYFLDELDGRLSSSKQEVVEKILNILDEEQPTIIYTPFLIDGHNDHVETTRSVLRALKLWNKEFDKIYMYEVNCPILPELVNSLSIMDRDLYDKKGDMYHIFSSQWAMGFDSFRLLDKRKSLIAEIGENSYEIYGAETFIRVDVKLLQRIEDMLKEEDFKPGFFRQLSSEYTLLSSFKTNGDLKKKYSYKAKNILASQVTEE